MKVGRTSKKQRGSLGQMLLKAILPKSSHAVCPVSMVRNRKGPWAVKGSHMESFHQRAWF